MLAWRTVQLDEDPSSSQWCSSFEKSLKGATSPDHISLSFTWCRFSRSPLFLLHFVRLFSKKKSLKVPSLQITFVFLFYFLVLPLSEDLPLSSFPSILLFALLFFLISIFLSKPLPAPLFTHQQAWPLRLPSWLAIIPLLLHVQCRWVHGEKGSPPSWKWMKKKPPRVVQDK